MSAEDRFTGEMSWPQRDTELNCALAALWAECDSGYIIHEGKYTCGQCQSSVAKSPPEVKHNEGCVQGLLDSIAKASAGEVREFAKAILHGSETHRAWLLEAAENFVHGIPIPESKQ